MNRTHYVHKSTPILAPLRQTVSAHDPQPCTSNLSCVSSPATSNQPVCSARVTYASVTWEQPNTSMTNPGARLEARQLLEAIHSCGRCHGMACTGGNIMQGSLFKGSRNVLLPHTWHNCHRKYENQVHLFGSFVTVTGTILTTENSDLENPKWHGILRKGICKHTCHSGLLRSHYSHAKGCIAPMTQPRTRNFVPRAGQWLTSHREVSAGAG